MNYNEYSDYMGEAIDKLLSTPIYPGDIKAEIFTLENKIQRLSLDSERKKYKNKLIHNNDLAFYQEKLSKIKLKYPEEFI